MLSLNQFRNREYLDEDNKYKREILKRIDANLKSQDPETATKVGDISPSDKLILNRLVVSFKKSLDNTVFNYYKKDIPEGVKNSEDLIAKWNNLVVFYNNNIDRKYQAYLDSQIRTGDVYDKMGIILDMAKKQDWVDYLDLIKLNGLLKSGKYEIVTHILFSQPTNIPIDLTERLSKIDIRKIRAVVKRRAKQEGETAADAKKLADDYKKNLEKMIKKKQMSQDEIKQLKLDYDIPLQHMKDVYKRKYTPYEIQKAMDEGEEVENVDDDE
jgi:hypothetical protein